MTNARFKEIRTNVKSFRRNFNFISDRLISIELNEVVYSMHKSEGKLTSDQLKYFEFISDFDIDNSIDM